MNPGEVGLIRHRSGQDVDRVREAGDAEQRHDPTLALGRFRVAAGGDRLHPAAHGHDQRMFAGGMPEAFLVMVESGASQLRLLRYRRQCRYNRQ
jgi:hypothetical protein